MLKKLLFLLLFPLFAFSTNRADSIDVSPRLIKEETISQYLKSSDFNYYNEEIKEIGFWDVFRMWLSDLIAEFFSNGLFSGTWQNIVLWIIIAGAFILIIVSLLKRRFGWFVKADEVTSLSYTIEDEHIDKLDFEQLIQKAVSEKNFNLAVRWQFLRSLKWLSDKSLISWQADKTNWSYFKQLSEPGIAKIFRELINVYEYAWYGDYKVEQEHYSELIPVFDRLKKELNV